ncbi:LOW QUALITY PROTEIN: probable flavin-containing monoamine oxidase A [Patiria miniata]|uniref:Amine oxidase n=1 Tax=Patiria miniata TaxID=46514 RepID=A0A914APV3_PATMI|nr:LOW QUALITY PROTEIN: probable flavin-containing monoamine oxidase A [Patiria miniata]
MAASSDSTSPPDWDVIIVGAGIAGLTAAYRLQKQKPGIKVLVLEAKDRVGGRTYTTELEGAHGKDIWDLGGQWVGSSQYHIIWLLNELGLEKYPQYTTGKKMMLLGNKGIRTYEASIPSMSYLSLIDLQRFMTATDKTAASLPVHNPMDAPDADILDSMTLETLVRQTTYTLEARDAIDIAINQIFGAQPRMLSALFYYYYVSSARDMRTLNETTDGANQEFRIKGGAQQISTILTDRIGQERVLLDHPVEHIDQRDAHKVTVVTEAGQQFTGRYVIVATPLHCSTNIEYVPTLPLERISLARHSPMAHLFKFIVTYQTAFWREDGFSGEIFSNGVSRPSKASTGPLQLTFDCTTPNGSPALVGFYCNGREWSQIEPAVRQAAILDALAEFFGPKAKEPLDYREKDWALEPYNGGCPVNVMTPGAMTYFHGGLRTPFDRVHWAGTESATHHCGYLSGAVQSGMRAASEVLGRLEPAHIRDEIMTALDGRRDYKDDEEKETWGWALGGLIGVAAVAALVVRKLWYY